MHELSTPLCLGVVVLVLVAAIALGSAGARAVPSFLFVVAVVLLGITTVLALLKGVAGLADVVLPSRRSHIPDLGRHVVGVIGNLAMTAFGVLVAYLSTFGFSRGRQLRRLGRVLLPGLRPSDAWASRAVSLTEGGRIPSEVAEQWRENGKTEHASVAAFARLTLDLMALGGPPRLIRAANEDALDEIRHAEMCFALASAIDGRAVSPAPFPEAQRVGTLPRNRTLALAKLAVDSLVDGALHEGVSARIIARLARRAASSAVRDVLKEIAADEGRHAAHGWTVVEWCLEEGGWPVGEALLGAIRALPLTMRSERPEPAARGDWERFGIHGSALEHEEYAAARALLVDRVRARVEVRTSRAAA